MQRAQSGDASALPRLRDLLRSSPEGVGAGGAARPDRGGAWADLLSGGSPLMAESLKLRPRRCAASWKERSRRCWRSCWSARSFRIWLEEACATVLCRRGNAFPGTGGLPASSRRGGGEALLRLRAGAGQAARFLRAGRRPTRSTSSIRSGRGADRRAFIGSPRTIDRRKLCRLLATEPPADVLYVGRCDRRRLQSCGVRGGRLDRSVTWRSSAHNTSAVKAKSETAC